MKIKTWVISWFVIVVLTLCVVGSFVYKIDPFFHYHAPNLEKYYYTLNNQRSQNDGILRHFEYDAMVVGTSMTENFKTSEIDKIFNCKAIKVPYSGGTYKEINDAVLTALKSNPNLRIVIRCLDMEMFTYSWDAMRHDLGDYPTYLYDANPINDVEYLLNKDVVFDRTYKMIEDSKGEYFSPGITSFDDYSRWQDKYTFGINSVCPDGVNTVEKEQRHLSDDDRKKIEKSIEYNIIRTAKMYPDVEFYLFYSPYSAVSWNDWKNAGTLYRMLEAEAFITERLIQYDNIHLFSFNNRTDLITDLNNYKDTGHYGSWINSFILKWMYNGQYQITKDNYKEYLEQEYNFYTTFDYQSLNGQEDYEADYYAGALLNSELTGISPLDVWSDEGTEKYYVGTECVGAVFSVDLDKGYNYLCFQGRKMTDAECVEASVLDENGELVYQDSREVIDQDLHMYVIDLSSLSGRVSIILNSGESSEINNEYFSFSSIDIF